MNLTLSVDEQTAEKAREAAALMGKSLNQAVRDYLQLLAGASKRMVEWEAYEARCKKSGGKLRGWTFNRDEANER